MRRSILCLAMMLLVPASTALALDTVKRTNGQSVSGTLESVSKDKVVIAKTGGSETIPTSDIESISFDGEPSQLKIVRSSIAAHSFDNALLTIDKLDATGAKPEVAKEIEFYKLYANAQKALASGQKIAEAGGALAQFLASAPDSYHYLPASELVGDMLVAAGVYDKAPAFYGALASSSSPVFQMRGANAIGRALLAQNKIPEAAAEFDKALALAAQAGDNLAAAPLRFAATLGKAACMSEQGQPDEAIKMVEEVIKGISVEDAELQAQAYVTLGQCEEKKGAKKEALLAYLHVDLLYFTNARADAIALKRMVVLWKELGKPERSDQARQMLADRYGVVATSP